MKRTLKQRGTLSPAAIVFLVLLPIAAFLASLCIGRLPISIGDVIASIFGGVVDESTSTVVLSMRLPRVLLATVVGAGLSVSGCAFQSLFANPLATPDTLGVASGASFGAALALLLGLGLGGVQLFALVMGAVAVGLTWLAGSGKGRGMSKVVLAGIMIGSLFTALVSLVKFAADTESVLPSITYWLMGSLGSAGYPTLAVGAPIILIGIIVMYCLRWRLNVLPLAEDDARATGTNIRALRIVVIIYATAMTASCISMCGQVGWVGLLVPHLCRMKFGSNHMALIPASISVGAAFLMIVDTIARSATAAEIPISILTAVVGAPFFILLMRRTGGWRI